MHIDSKLPVGPDGESLPVVVSHSINNTFDSCARRFELGHVYGVTARGGASGLAAEAGTALHEAVQAWAAIALHPSSPRTEQTQEDAIDAGLYTLMLWWPWTLEDIAREDKKAAATQRSFERTLLLFMSVVESDWWQQWEVAVDRDGELCIEVPWHITHESMPGFVDHLGRHRYFVTQGKIDFVLRNRRTRALRIVDLKTSVKSIRELEASFRYSGQGAGYAIALNAMLGLPWRDTGLEVTYLAAIFGTATEFPEPVEPLNYYYDPEDIEDMLRTNEDRLLRMQSYGSRGWWPRKSSGCDMFGSICMFFDICSRRDSAFIDKWLRFSPDYVESSRVYVPKWRMIA